MESPIRFPSIFQIEKRQWVFIVVLVAATHLFCQTLMLPYGSALLSLLPGSDIRGKDNLLSRQSYAKAITLGDSLLKNSDSGDKDRVGGLALDDDLIDNEPDFVEDITLDDDFLLDKNVDMDENFAVENVRNQSDGIMLEMVGETRQGLSLEQTVKPRNGISTKTIRDEDSAVKVVNTFVAFDLNKSTAGKQIPVLPINENYILYQSDADDYAITSKGIRKKMRCDMPPKSVTSLHQMNRLLVRNRAKSRATKPRWSSVRDQEIIAAKLQIANASSGKNDPELYAPLFRNASMFKRSYELMEHRLKVYVYKDGEKPIFHQPILKGLYASEGWFMKLMEGNKHFLVKDPRKAHLFYMPFSTRMLEHTIYVRNSHNRTNLRQYLKEYAEKIAATYPFWNRTGGADHFLVACHDWAPYETRHHMEHCIKALCNADVTTGFKIGRDVSLPESYVRSARDPLRDLGGKPPPERHIFAFYAGNMHGYLRPILLKYWNNKDPDMKIYGPMPPGVASKMNYIQHMKSSKYCICPKGHEVNSPRVVEAIFYECVPVIISDNFVPPFFEVLDWDAFAVIVAEKHIPDLKDILLSISQDKYLKLQLGVRKVQQHFLWHVKPIKYDLFHMTLHSIWYNRVFQIKPR